MAKNTTIYNTVFVDGNGFIELSDADKAWLAARKRNWEEHEFLAKSGDLERQLESKPMITDGKQPKKNWFFFDD